MVVGKRVRVRRRKWQRAKDEGSGTIRILTHRLHPSLMNVAKGFSVSLSPIYAGHEQDCCTKWGGEVLGAAC